MRQRLLREGARELSYEIREIVKKARQIEKLGQRIYWENIGDPIQKNNKLPGWIKDIIVSLISEDQSYGYSDSKGMPETREFLSGLNNQRGGARITAEDILFFNGLGDAIGKLYQYLIPSSRVIGTSPAYSTHSSAEAAHANTHPLTYNLNPADNWYPDMDDLYMKVKYNPNIVGILIINPDNPTGMVYPLPILRRFVEIAREFNLFLIADEIYLNVTYNGAISHALSEYIEELPGISLKGISKEFPWPGSRCGWMEFYNRHSKKEFHKLCSTLENAKMIEVSATRLPQLTIPRIMGDRRYKEYIRSNNEKIGRRAKIIAGKLAPVKQIMFNETFGAFYNTIVFRNGVLTFNQSMKIENTGIRNLIETWVNEEKVNFDKRFVYYLLGAKGVCVVPLSSFSSDLLGFRVTLLEEDEEILNETFNRIGDGLREYFSSVGGKR
ncbi:MAG TPA: pyridoxal phosphate-dependent aminotransferase [Cyclobacteriaceae bacterium]|nr:pyridoxal phosphate-dependent aminotransferase [Cyclobacteriaceae bacterium]